MTNPVHKVTCFITCSRRSGPELLLFNHPNAGTQIPAGTVEPGETPEAAARREATEKSGLAGLVLIRSLGESAEPLHLGYALVIHPTPVYSRPQIGSFDWADFRTGLPVEVVRHEAGFTQVSYIEPDRFPNPQFTTFAINGWVPDEALTNQRVRHFYLFDSPNPSPAKWSVATDNHIFELFWVSVNDLPPIVSPQDGWLKWLKDTDLIGF